MLVYSRLYEVTRFVSFLKSKLCQYVDEVGDNELCSTAPRSKLLGIQYMSFVSFLKSKLCQYVDRVRDNNRLRIGVGRFNSNMYSVHMGFSRLTILYKRTGASDCTTHFTPLSSLSTT